MSAPLFLVNDDEAFILEVDLGDLMIDGERDTCALFSFALVAELENDELEIEFTFVDESSVSDRPDCRLFFSFISVCDSSCKFE